MSNTIVPYPFTLYTKFLSSVINTFATIPPVPLGIAVILMDLSSRPGVDKPWPARLLEEIHLVTFSIIILVN